MKKIIFLFTILIIIISCNSNLNVKLSSENVFESIEDLCIDIGDEKCEKLKERYKVISIARLYKKGEAAIIMIYGKQYKDLTLQDLMNKIEDDEDEDDLINAIQEIK